jgi:hypothetical protein
MKKGNPLAIFVQVWGLEIQREGGNRGDRLQLQENTRLSKEFLSAFPLLKCTSSSDEESTKTVRVEKRPISSIATFWTAWRTAMSTSSW